MSQLIFCKKCTELAEYKALSSVDFAISQLTGFIFYDIVYKV